MNDESSWTRRAVLGGVTGLAAGTLIGVDAAAAADVGELAAPHIIPCGNWGARPPSEPVTLVRRRPAKLIIHHTVTANTGDFSRKQAKRHARQVQNIHMNGNGWRDTGYLFIVSRGGFITEGRHRSLARLRGGDDFVLGAHTTGQNDKGVGIALEGNYDVSAPIPAQQWRSLVRLCTFACRSYRIPAKQIFGHRDFSATACPGQRMYRRIVDLRKEVRGRL